MPRATKTKSISLDPVTLGKGVRLAKKRGFKNSFSALVAKLIEEDDARLNPKNGAKLHQEAAA